MHLPADRRFPPNFYRTAAICSWISVLTTLGLIFLPEWFAPGDSFEARMARVQDPVYVLRSWIYLLHPFVVVTAALGVAIRLRAVAAAWVLPGLLGFMLWGATEAAQQTLTLVAFDPWREAFLAGDEAIRSTMELRTALYDGVWNAMFALLLIGFLLGSALYAAAILEIAAADGGFERVLGWFYGAVALLTAFGLLREFGLPSPPPQLDDWLYPAIQPLGRTLIGVWLWRTASPGRSPSA